jgi:hypothetical protein
MHPVNFFFLLSPRTHRIPILLPARLLRRSSSAHCRQPSPPLFFSNFVLHKHHRISLPPPDPLFFLLPRTHSSERHAGDLTLHRRSISSRTKVPPLLLLCQEHHQHYISTPKPSNQFPSPSCTPVTETPSPPSEPHRAGSVSSRTAASELPFYDSDHSQVCCELLNLFPTFPSLPVSLLARF